MLEEYINKLSLPNFKIHDKPLTSNVLGAKSASELLWKASVANGK